MTPSPVLNIPTDLEVATLLCAQYHQSPTAEIVEWDYIDIGANDWGVYWSAKRVKDVTVICLRGSITIEDWLRDIMAVAMPYQSKGLGPVHPGFKIGMDIVLSEIKTKTNPPWLVAGHSLGAARSAILCGQMLLDGITPVGRVVFGEPKAGFAPLAKILQGLPFQRSYRNKDTKHHDLVTDIPFSFSLLSYVHPTELIDVCEPPHEQEKFMLGAFSYHHMDLYRMALSNLEKKTAEITVNITH